MSRSWEYHSDSRLVNGYYGITYVADEMYGEEPTTWQYLDGIFVDALHIPIHRITNFRTDLREEMEEWVATNDPLDY